MYSSLLHEKRILTLKKRWRRRLGKRSQLTPISANGKYQFLCILLSIKVIFQPNIPAQSHSTTCACRIQFTFRVELENNRIYGFSALEKVKCTLETCSGTIRDARF